MGVVNPILGLLLAMQAATGLAHEALPPELFETLHVAGGVALVLTAILHVYLNREWVKARYFARPGGGASVS